MILMMRSVLAGRDSAEEVAQSSHLTPTLQVEGMALVQFGLLKP